MARYYAFGPFRLDAGSDMLVGPHGPVALGQRAGVLLRTLVSQPGVLLTKSELMDAAWPGLAVEEGNLTVQISILRRTLAEAAGGGQWIGTVARRGYRFVGAVQESGSLPTPRIGDVSGTGPANADRPSVAVLPFENAAGDPAKSYVSDGVTADIIIALSRFSGLLVIAANSSFRYRGHQVDIRTAAQELGVRYVVRGSVRHSGDRIRISVQLIEAATGTHRWADRYECPASDVFAVQDEVTGCIVGVLVAQLTKAERDRILRKPPESWQAYDLYLRATDRSRQWDREAFAAGERWLEQAVALDPNFAPAYALLADCHMSAWIEPKDLRYQDPATLDAAWRLAQAAMERDPLLPAAHAAFGNILHWRGEAEEAIRAYERALELNPNSAQFFYGHVLSIAGRPLDGLAVLQRSMRLDPFFNPMLLGQLGHCYLMLGNERAALAPLRECAARAPRWRPAFVWLAAACMRLDLVNEARAAAARVLDIEPNFSIDAWRRLHPYRDLKGPERMYKALRAVGLPERSSTSFAV
jgi:TolB-like protein/tetratricopeptide (TPR) repeat protein